MLGHMGGARAYIPKAVRQRSNVKVLQRKLKGAYAAAESSTPAWVRDIISSGGAAEAGVGKSSGSGGGSGSGNGGDGSGRGGGNGGASGGGGDDKQHRFSRAQGQAFKRSREVESREAERQRCERERVQKLKARSAQKTVIRMRTSKGQPMLGARMKGLLGKVERLVGGTR